MVQGSNRESSESSEDEKPKVCSYRIGCCLRSSSLVSWKFSDSLAAAQELFSEESKQSSVVLFDEQTHAPLCFLSIHPADVACILQAFHEEEATTRSSSSKQSSSSAAAAAAAAATAATTPTTSTTSTSTSTTSTVIDRASVEQAVASGDAPFVPPSRSKTHQWLLKRTMDSLFWRESVHFFSAGPHRYASLCSYNVHRHPQVKGHVALTLDDAPCRFSSRANSRMQQVLGLLTEYQATATFMMVGKFMEKKCHEQDLIDLFQQGHEMGNHGMVDRAYDTDSPENFARAVDECTERIHQVQQLAGVPERVQYFRAPHGKYTKSMEQVLHSRGLVNVMCDTYASCPIVEDGEYIGSTLSQRAQDGSIVLLHMPERGFRDWCMVALRRLLRGMRERNLQLVSVSRLRELADSCTSE